MVAGKKKATTRKRTRKSAAKTSFPAKQWEMPAGFCADGSQQATLREVVDPDVATIQLSELSLEQRADLVTKRIELQSQIDLAMIGAGVIDKSRALTEVRNKTKVGKLLIEIEHQMIRNLMEQAQQKKSARRRQPAKRKAAARKS